MSSQGEVGVDMSAWGTTGTFGTDMDMTSVLLSSSRCLMRAPLTPAVRNASNAAALGLLVSLVDVAGSEPALASCRPDWTATQDLAVHATRKLLEGPVAVDARMVRMGKKTITVTADVYDAQGVLDFPLLQRVIDEGKASLAATGLLTFARIPGQSAAGMDAYDPARWIGQLRRRSSDHAPEGTLQSRLNARVVDGPPGVLELERTRYVTNSIGTIFGGAQATLLYFAAEAMRPGMEASDIQVHYLAQLKVGPVRTHASVLRDAADHSLVSVRLVDSGNQDQPLALATVLLVRS